MEITLTVNGKQVKATVDEKEMKKAMGEHNRDTGYDIGNDLEEYHYISDIDTVEKDVLYRSAGKHLCRAIEGNYYSNRQVATNNAKADSIIRRLRRLAAQHGGCKQPGKYGYEIFWDSNHHTLEVMMSNVNTFRSIGAIVFETSDAAEIAIKTFKDELLWYFTEYDPMPEGWWGN